MIIRWLFDPNYSWLFVIICDYLVSGPAAGWLFASFPKAFAWNSLVMAAFRLRKSQPASREQPNINTSNHTTLILVIWLATFSACSALLKPKCQKMSSTRCSIFSLKRQSFVTFCTSSASTHLDKIASWHAGRLWPQQAVVSLTLRLLLPKVGPLEPCSWDARLAFQRSRQGKGRPPCQECNRRNTQTLVCRT